MVDYEGVIIFPDEKKHGKWTKEEVWVYRNERGDIMRAQDDHPANAVAEAYQRVNKRVMNK